MEKNKKFKYDGRSRPADDTYRKRWKEIFDKGVVNNETTVKDLHAWYKTMDCGSKHLDKQEKYKADKDLQKIIKGVKEDERQTKTKK